MTSLRTSLQQPASWRGKGEALLSGIGHNQDDGTVIPAWSRNRLPIGEW
jgi:hypothetical protein